MTQKSPKLTTPQAVRNATWKWVRDKASAPTLPGPHYSKIIAAYWADTPFREASRMMERLDSPEYAEMPRRERVEAMKDQGRIMFARVRALMEQAIDTETTAQLSKPKP